MPDFIGSAKLGNCAKKRTPNPAEAGIGGFPCWATFALDLILDMTQTPPVLSMVDPNRAHFLLQPGECVRWKVTATDGSAVGITLVNFLDTDAEAVAAGKGPSGKSTYPIGRDFCTEGSPQCFLYIALDRGHYRYQVKVRSSKGEHVLDPELEVVCTPPGCGDPDDLAGGS